MTARAAMPNTSGRRQRHVTLLEVRGDVLGIVGQLLEQLVWRTRWPESVLGQTMLNITLYYLTAFLRSAHSAALQHQLRWTACVASEEGRKITPGFLAIGVGMAKDNTPGFDLIIFPAIGPGKGGNFRLPLGKFLRRDKRGKPAVRQ